MDKTFDEFQPKSEFYYDRGDRYEIKKKHNFFYPLSNQSGIEA